MKSLFVLLFTISSALVYSQTCVGKWVTIDDKTNKKKSIVELYKKDKKLYGKVIYIFPKEGQDDDPICTKCEGKRKDQPIKGMHIIEGLTWDGKVWKTGKILDPEEGKEYTVKLWVNSKMPDRLNVRGYIGPLYRTQTWIRMPK